MGIHEGHRTSPPDEHRQFKQSLSSEVNNVQSEARMILPGIQALFGFQLIVAFNPSFKTQTTPIEQYLHLISLLCMVISTIFVVAPAAYHRQAEHHISEHFIKLSSRFLTMALVPLSVGTCLDIYIISHFLTDSIFLAYFCAFSILSMFIGIWFVLPRYRASSIKQIPLVDLKNERNENQ